MKKKNWFTVKRIKPWVYAIAEFKHDEKVVSYLVIGERQTALFDTGMGMADIKSEVAKLTDLPIKVYLTHSHWDHVGGLRQFENQPDWIDFEIQKISTPGHSPDSVCYFLPHLDTMVAGDTLYPGPIYLHLPESDLMDYWQSLRKLSQYVDEKTLILPGHNRVACESSLFWETKKLCRQIVLGKASYKINQRMKANEYMGSEFSILVKA